MDTRALRSEIEAEGRARIDAIRRATVARIAQMRAQQRAEAEQTRAQAMRSPDRELRAGLARDVALARIAGQRRVLEARRSLLDRVFAAARDQLGEAFDTQGARDRLLQRAREALGYLPEGKAVIVCSPGVAELLEKNLDPGGDVRIESQADLPIGFRITAAGGALVIDGTLEQLLEQGRPVLAIDVLRRLREETA